MVPADRDEEIKWPEGTTKIQCEASPSGHWMVGVGHWSEMSENAKTAIATTYHSREEETDKYALEVFRAFKKHSPENIGKVDYFMQKYA